MCGIGGILRFDGKPVDRDKLEAMRRVLACRGPDGHGFHVEGPIGLVHTRLAIIDKETGAQPMTRGNLTVVFNGEIYNHRELRKELESLGHHFTSDHADTEVLLHGYKQWGKKLPTKLEGMFAFAIWNPAEQTLFLARDRCGKKPIYLHHDEKSVSFGSTASSLLTIIQPVPIHSETVRNPLLDYLELGYGQFSNIYECVSGAYAFVELKNESTLMMKYWNPFEPNKKTSEDYLELLLNSVHKRLEADVPLGCFLSGGIDSSLIAAMAQKRLAEQGGRLKTFSVSMPDTRYDEGPFAKQVADYLGCQHHELHAEPNVEEDLLYLIRTMGEPFGDSSILPTYWLSKATRQHVTVALSGDGGDELFGGYKRYVAMRLIRHRPWWIRLLPKWLFGGEQKSTRAQLGRLVKAARYRKPIEQYLSIIRIFDEVQLVSLGLDPLTQPNPSIQQYDRYSAHFRSRYGSKDYHQDPVDFARYWDFFEYLSNDLLRKVDRASMAVGLEVRCPFLDTALVEAALSTPMKVLMPGRTTKPILRQIARKYLPEEICNRKKMGFAVPIGLWFRNELRPLLQKWLLDSPALPGLGLNRDYIEQLIREHQSGKLDHTHRLFALLTLSMWRHEFPVSIETTDQHR